jgi:hypothetical protein
MRHRRYTLCLAAVVCCNLLAVGQSNASAGHATKARVLDLAFPRTVPSEAYHARLTLRYGNDDSQLVLTIYPGAKYDLLQYYVAGSSEVSSAISKILAGNPSLSDEQVLQRLTIKSRHINVSDNQLIESLAELRHLKVAAFPKTRVAVDEFATFDYYLDMGQENIHYTLTSTTGGHEQGALIKWMLSFRSSVLSGIK